MLKPRTGFFLAALLMLSACQVPAGVVGKKPTPPATGGKPGATGTGSAAAFLVKPSDASTLLSGKVEIDAHYLLGTGQGKLIGTAAGNVIAAGGGNLIGTAAGNLIGTAAGNLIGTAAGNLIGKRKFGIMAETSDKLELGATLPAAEMEIMAYSMADGKPLTLGVDKDGKPVISVYTDAKGAYQIYLPAKITGANIRVVAVAPESKDARLAYEVVSGFGDKTDQLISEDTALMSAYLTEAFVSRLERLFRMSRGGTNPTGVFGNKVPKEMIPLLTPLMTELSAATVKAKAADLPTDKRRALARRATDALLAYVPTSNVKLKSGDLVLPKLVEALHEMRQAAAKKMKSAGEDYFNQQDYVKEANADAATTTPYAIKRPSDLNDFVLRRYLTAEEGVTDGILKVFVSADIPAERLDLVTEAMEALSTQILLSLMTNTEAKKALVAAIEAGI